jgi:protoheme IX farnesyltransferase
MDVAVEIPIWSGPRSIRSTLKSYIALTKPRVIELLLLVTVPTMFLAENGVPSLWLVLATLVGGTLSAGSAGAFNCYIDRDIDRVMHRTQGRPLVTGDLTDR